MKDLNQTIASRAYLATDEQVRQLAILNFESSEGFAKTGGTFLRIEVAALQSALGIQPRQRAGGKPQRFDKDNVMATYRDVHNRLYALVLDAVVTPDIADNAKLRKAEKQRRALERNRRSNFARTVKSTLGAFIRAGGNVAALVVPSVTKGMLSAETKKLKPATELDRDAQADRICSSMVKRIENIREEDHELAQMVAQRLTVQLSPVTAQQTTRSPTKSVEEGIPLKLEGGIFLPMPPMVEVPPHAGQDGARAH